MRFGDLHAPLSRSAAGAGPPRRRSRRYGFEAIELFATREPLRLSRRCGRSRAAASGWRTTGLALHGVHAPITERFGAGDMWLRATRTRVGRRDAAAGGGAGSGCGAADRQADPVQRPGRAPAVRPAEQRGTGDNNRGAAARSLQEICRAGRAARRPGGRRSDPERSLDAGGAGRDART